MFTYTINSEKAKVISEKLSVIVAEIENGSFSGAGTIYQLNTPILKFSRENNNVLWFEFKAKSNNPRGFSDL